jgi:hypothetical protein
MKKQNQFLQFPLVRIQPAAHQHLLEVYKAMKEAGRPISMTLLASDAILSIPIPNGHQLPASPENPCLEE